MEAIIFVGIQASGKSSFFREQFFDTHVRINLDMLKTRHREDLLLRACIEMRQPFVVDNTNPSIQSRQKYIQSARSAGFRVGGYYFQSRISDSIQRNSTRAGKAQIPVKAILGTSRRLETPSLSEGFDALYHVRIGDIGGFIVEEWLSEV